MPSGAPERRLSRSDQQTGTLNAEQRRAIYPNSMSCQAEHSERRDYWKSYIVKRKDLTARRGARWGVLTLPVKYPAPQACTAQWLQN